MSTVTIEIAFVVDTTGSMKDDINAVRDSLFDIVDSVTERTENLTIRFAVVSYRDHPPQDRSYVTKIFDFTDDIKKVHKVISKLKPSEGGDTPEAVADAIHDAHEKLGWSKNAYKALLLVGDAPPHGREYNSLSDDYFPDGCPMNLDPREEMMKFKNAFQQTAFVFVCGCNPLVEKSFRSIASSVEDGKYYPLNEAEELPTAIMKILEGVGDLIDVDRKVLAYYQSKDGAFDVAEAATELDLPVRELKISISRLMELERIPRWPKGRPLHSNSDGVEVELGQIPSALVPGKMFKFPVKVSNPGKVDTTVRFVATLITEAGITEMVNVRHDIGGNTSRDIEIDLTPMVSEIGKASVKVEVRVGSQTITERIYKTRLY